MEEAAEWGICGVSDVDLECAADAILSKRKIPTS
jgi:hypothetical protein